MAKVRLPEGRIPLAKSAALAGAAPLPATDQAAVCTRDVSPLRVMVKVRLASVPVPSGLLLAAAAIARLVSSFWTVPVALAVVIPLMPMMERYGVSPNIAAITAVVVGLLVGAKLAERVAKLWGLPEETK